jgi:hypothetical protein
MRRPRHARSEHRYRPPPGSFGAVGAGLAVLAGIVFVIWPAGGARRTAEPTPAHTAAAHATGSTPTLPSTTTTTAPPTTTTTSPLPPAGDAQLPQTDVQPTAGTPAFDAEMAALWAGITTGQPGTAMAAFFPEGAYAQVKSYWDDNADWTDRLVGHFNLDVEAAHALLGADAAGATLTQVIVPTSGVSWIPPGTCDNRIGYWHVGGSRLVYQEDGVEKSIGIASLISWRGYWYVVHLGSVTPPSGEGVVASPSSGTGYAGGYESC